jgi:translation initiation factor IF-2
VAAVTPPASSTIAPVASGSPSASIASATPVARPVAAPPAPRPAPRPAPAAPQPSHMVRFAQPD